jgi:hypothetical protein
LRVDGKIAKFIFQKCQLRGLEGQFLIPCVSGEEKSTTLYVFGSWGSRFKIKVVLPLPKKPVTTVTGVGRAFIDSIKDKDMMVRFLVDG